MPMAVFTCVTNVASAIGTARSATPAELYSCVTRLERLAEDLKDIARAGSITPTVGALPRRSAVSTWQAWHAH
jgi:hypothetical protein